MRKHFEQLRKERDHLIHAAQVKELKTYSKPVMTSYEEPIKRRIYNRLNR